MLFSQRQAYLYLKAEPKISPQFSLPTFRLFQRKVLAGFLIVIGLTFLFLVFWPMIVWRVSYVPRLSTAEIIRPIPEARAFGQRVAGVKSADFTKASAWFPDVPQKPITSRVTSYTLAIPKLKIFDAVAIIGGEDLGKSLIHYGGTALPGEYGKAVIFGHSILPQFFDPKNYKAIFSTLHTLKPGDEVLVNFDGIRYRYKVFEIEIVEPTNISVLEQKYDDSYLVLITCTPPGTYWKRLVVKTRLEKL